jgi:hypothetical protein
MGSAGTGRFSDYPGSQSEETAESGTQEGGDSGSEGGSGSDRCLDDIPAIRLEEVERCAYF